MNKENIESINCSKSKSFGGHDESVRGGYNESTLNLWKYLVPSHPGEMEEDAFIVDEQVIRCVLLLNNILYFIILPNHVVDAGSSRYCSD